MRDFPGSPEKSQKEGQEDQGEAKELGDTPRRLELPGNPGKSQKEGQEDQGEVKELGGTPLAVLGSPGPPGLPSGFSLASLELH